MTDDIKRAGAITDTDDLTGTEMADIGRQLEAAASGRPIIPLPTSVAAAIAADNAAQAAGNDTPADTTPAPPAAAAAGGKNTKTMPHNRDGLIRYLVDDYLAAHPVSLPGLLDPEGDYTEQVREDILNALRLPIELENATRAKNDKIKPVVCLSGYIAARIIMATGDIRMMVTGLSGLRIIAKHYYKPVGSDTYKWAGTYNIVNCDDYADPVMIVFQQLCPNGTRQDEMIFRRELSKAKRCYIKADAKLVWMRNGLWDGRKRVFTPYDDPDFDRLYPTQITLAKLPVYHVYGPGAHLHPDANGKLAKYVIHNDEDGTDWSPDQMWTDLFDMTTAKGRASSLIIQQSMQFMIRGINGAPCLYFHWINSDGEGHNGKGALWDMMHRLLEKDYEPGDDDLTASGSKVIKMPIDELDDTFRLSEDIMTAYAIVGEETDSSIKFIKNCATYKMLSRAQSLTYRSIYGKPFTFAYSGFLLQQSNQLPHFAEKNESVLSHACVIDFTQHFTDDTSYVKNDYVRREETAEWIMYHLTVEMPFYDSYDLNALKTLEPNKKDIMRESIPTLQFLDDVIPGLHMDFLPLELLYDLYVRWCDTNGEKPVTQRMMRDDLKQYAISNKHAVKYVSNEERPRTKVADVNQWHPAVAEFGNSRRLGRTDYIDHRANLIAGQGDYSGRLEPSMMMRTDSKGRKVGKTWSRGGLMRTIPWQSQIVDDDVDND